ncbi:MAG: VWA domain-containing protein [Phycisphaerae bacterium]|nr:VWA domain-containing protein [Phycisphaerae bacterium]
MGNESGEARRHERPKPRTVTAITLTLALLATTAEIHASEQDQVSSRLYAVLDNSGSMRRAFRFRRGVEALERWAESVDIHTGLTVELLVAADEVVHYGTFPLQSESDRGAMLDRLRELEPERSSTTVFRKIDEELASFVARTTRADERFGVVFITDGLSDVPATDLRLAELGDRLLLLGGGLYAAVSGLVPGQEELLDAKQGQSPSPRFESRRSRSRCRRLFGPSIAVATPPPLRAEVDELLLGGSVPVRSMIQVENTSEIAREVRLQAQAPEGSTARFVPDALVIAARAKAEVTLEIEVVSPLSGSIVLAAQGPDGAVVETTLNAEITTRPWLLGNWAALVAFAAAATLLFAILFRLSQRPWFIVPIGRPDRGFQICPDEEVPLSMADPGFPSGIWIARRRGGLWLRTSDEPVRLGGALLQPGREVPCRLRTPIDAGAASVVLDRRSRRQAGAHPLLIAGAMEHAPGGNDLL